MTSNRLVLIDREEIDPSIEGVDFGGRTYVIARSPEAVLIWTNGHSASINGFQRYHGPVMTLLADRRQQVHNCYKRIVEDVRLTSQVFKDVWPKLEAVFGFEAYDYMQQAIKNPKRTLLIEGGGPRLAPSRWRSREDYDRWYRLPPDERGFMLPEQARARDRRSFGHGHTPDRLDLRK